MIPLLAELPTPNSPEAIGWFVATLAAAIVALNQVFTFYKSHMKEKPDPAETYLTNKTYEEHQEQRSKDLQAIKDGIEAIHADNKATRISQAKARSRIHSRQNRMENALYYMAGKQEDGHSARVIRERLESPLPEDSDED